jgi:hypothetical protein
MSEPRETFWKRYPEEKPEDFLPNCIIIDKWGKVHTNVYWSREDSKHDHSVWQRAKYYCETKEILKSLPTPCHFESPVECRYCGEPMDIYGYILTLDGNKTPVCFHHYTEAGLRHGLRVERKT